MVVAVIVTVMLMRVTVITTTGPMLSVIMRLVWHGPLFFEKHHEEPEQAEEGAEQAALVAFDPT